MPTEKPYWSPACAEAAYRTLLEQVYRKAMGYVPKAELGYSVEELEAKAKAVAKYAPALVASIITDLFHKAGNAWERGNNSGNSGTRTRMTARCNALRRIADRAMALWHIEVDYPGLYPSFKVKGYEHHSVLSAIRAATKN